MGRTVSIPAVTGLKNPLSLQREVSSYISVYSASTDNTFSDGVEKNIFSDTTGGVLDFLVFGVTGTGTLTIAPRVVVDGVEYTDSINPTSAYFTYYGTTIDASTDMRMPQPITYNTIDVYVTFSAATSFSSAVAHWRYFSNA